MSMLPGGYGGGGMRDSYASSQASSAASQAGEASRNVSHLEDRLERLNLICMAMWSLIQDKTNLTEQDLMQRVKVLDQVDGEADGKTTRSVQKCHKCDRTMSPRHQK
ncbi:MAG: hypothetical protein ACODAQ_04880, partial [Phycisphaeraceae bacterium]